MALSKPLYSQVRDMVLGRIRTGEWKAGDTLPNEFVLATQFGVSIGTIRRAIEGLEDSGIVVRKQGRGTFVTGFASRAMEQKFCPLFDEFGRERIAIDYELVSVLRRRARGDEADILLGIDGGDVIDIRQLLRSAGRVRGVETSVVPASLFPRLEKQVSSGQQLYPLFSNFGVLVTRAEEAIDVRVADDEIASLMSVQAGERLLRVQRKAFAYDGKMVELRESNYQAEGLSYVCSIS